MLCGDGDVYPRFTEALELKKEVGGEVAGTMLRCARRVYWEYQRQLWDPRVAEVIKFEEGYAAERAKVAEAQLRARRPSEDGFVGVFKRTAPALPTLQKVSRNGPRLAEPKSPPAGREGQSRRRGRAR